MEIWVSFDGQKFTISPDPARVKVNTPVIWRFQANQVSTNLIRWTVLFREKSPFQFQAGAFTTTTQSVQGQHSGATGAMAPDKPGDYKYAVRADDALTQSELGEDDPYLTVTL
jgi:hypothetical protein